MNETNGTMGSDDTKAIAKHLSLETLSAIIQELNAVKIPRNRYTEWFMLDCIELYNEKVSP